MYMSPALINTDKLRIYVFIIINIIMCLHMYISTYIGTSIVIMRIVKVTTVQTLYSANLVPILIKKLHWMLAMLKMVVRI